MTSHLPHLVLSVRFLSPALPAGPASSSGWRLDASHPLVPCASRSLTRSGSYPCMGGGTPPEPTPGTQILPHPFALDTPCHICTVSPSGG